MKFSTKAEYGLRAIIRIGKNYGRSPYSLSKIAKEEGISLRYLERLVKRLKHAGLVEATKGVKGGYELSRNPRHINVYEILKALEGSLAPFICVDDKAGCCNKACPTKMVWLKLKASTEKTLKNIKLSELTK